VLVLKCGGDVEAREREIRLSALSFNSREANQMAAPCCYTCFCIGCAPPPPAPSRLSVTRNKTIKQLMKPCFFYMCADTFHISLICLL